MSAVHLTDFGLAKSTATGSKYTRTGQALGTPAYMSPEQARGDSDLTPATDVWALGCVLYELLAGRRAFEGETPAAVIGAVLTRPPAPLRGVPRSVVDLVAGCLQGDARARQPGAASLRADCERVLAGARARFRPPRPRAAVRGAVLAAAVLALAGTGVWVATPSARVPAVLDGTDLEAERLATQGWGLRQLDLAKAGMLLAQALARAPHRQDWRIQLGLLQWADGDDVEGATETWEQVPRGSSLWTRARWLQGLAWTARNLDSQDPETTRRWEAAWSLASGGAAPEADWARAGLLRERQPAEAIELLGGTGEWTASLLRGMVGCPSSDVLGLRTRVAAYTHALENGLPFAWANVNRGVMRGELGDAEGERADYDAALRLRPTCAEALYNRGVLRARQGDVAGARDDFDAALGHKPGFARAHARRGLLRAQHGDPAGAGSDYDAALRFDPDLTETYVYRGVLRAEHDDVEGAIADLHAALSRDPTAAEAYFHRGRLRGARGDVDGEMADYDAALRHKPAYPQVYLRRSLLKEQRGDVEGALAECDAALRACPEVAELHGYRGLVRARNGELAGAESDFARALDMAPPDWEQRPVVAQALERIRSARAALPK